jgi:hypothetical protein
MGEGLREVRSFFDGSGQLRLDLRSPAYMNPKPAVFVSYAPLGDAVGQSSSVSCWADAMVVSSRQRQRGDLPGRIVLTPMGPALRSDLLWP